METQRTSKYKFLTIAEKETERWNVVHCPDAADFASAIYALSSMPELREEITEAYDKGDISGISFNDVLVYGLKQEVVVEGFQYDLKERKLKGLALDKKSGKFAVDEKIYRRTELPLIFADKHGNRAMIFESTAGVYIPTYYYNHYFPVPTQERKTLSGVFPIRRTDDKVIRSPVDFVDNYEEAKECYIATGLAETLGKYYERWIFELQRHQPGNHGAALIEMAFDNNRSMLYMDRNPWALCKDATISKEQISRALKKEYDQ